MKAGSDIGPAILSERSAIMEMMGDYAVMRDQVRACPRL
jgi:hypothetical protein